MIMKKMIIALLFIMLMPVSVAAEEDTDIDLSMYDFEDVSKAADGFDFEAAVDKLVNGDVNGAIEEIGNALVNVLVGEFIEQKEIIIKIIIIGVVAAVFTNISGAFLNNGVSETGFYVTFMALISSLTAGYMLTAEIVTSAMDKLIELISAIVPVYILSVGFSAGQTSALAFYEVITIVIVLIEKVLQSVIIPMIYVLMIISILNNLTEKNIFSKACELIKNIINWGLKSMMAVVIGINFIQGMISPFVDSLKTTAFGKTLSIIPGVGETLSSVSGIILASGTLIKNSIGMASMTAVIVICLAPVVKVIIMSLTFKVASAVLEPVSDKRIINSITYIYDCIVLLMKTLLYAVVFFLLTIAIICSSTNINAR